MNYSNVITIQTLTSIRDSYGQPVDTYTDDFKVGADIRQGFGVSAVSAAKETETVVMFFDVRRTSKTISIKNADRIVTIDGEAWDIFNLDKYTKQKDNVIRITARLRR